MGTGMAFPWHVIEGMELASDAIVEDMKLGLELAMGEHGVVFCSDACVESVFPLSDKDADSQRRRWEHGHLGMILQYSPQLLLASLRQRNAGLFFLALDLMVPPLALQTILLLFGLGLTAMSMLFASPGPFLTIMAGCVLFGFVLLVIWHRFARHVIGWKELLRIPAYIFSKVSVYSGFIKSRESAWVRTGRGSHE